MRSEKRTILALVAAGRISAADAERLVRAWNQPAQWFLAAMVCLVVLLANPNVHALMVGAHSLHQLARLVIQASHAAAGILLQAKEGTV